MNRDLFNRIEALHARYVRVIDDDTLELWPDLFVEDGRYCITTRENHALGLPMPLYACHGRGMMRDRVTGLRRINVYEPHCYRHQTSALELLDPADGDICCISNFLVVRTMQGGAMSLFATGVYRDRLREEPDGALRFVERLVITDSRQTDTLLVIPL